MPVGDPGRTEGGGVMLELGLTLPLSAAVAKLWGDTAATLGPEADFTAVIQPIERAAGVTVASPQN